MASDHERRAVRGANGRVQVKKVRAGCITAGKRGIFLEHLAATANVAASARATGIHVRSFYALRARDPQFAAEWDRALEVAEPRLLGKMIVYAETMGDTPGEPDDGLAGFDPKAAMETLNLYRGRRERRYRPRGGGPKPRTASREETEAEALKVLKKLARRLRKQ